MPAGVIPKPEREYKKLREKEDTARVANQQRSERVATKEQKAKGK